MMQSNKKIRMQNSGEIVAVLEYYSYIRFARKIDMVGKF